MGIEAPYLSIGQVADLIGVSVMTIRSWERRYGWPCAEQSCPRAHRRYPSSDEGAFRAVAHLRRSMNTRAAIDLMLVLAVERDGCPPSETYAVERVHGAAS